MLSGLMMDYQLTIDRVLEHGNRLYPHKKIRTKLPDGTLHEYSFRDFYGRVKRLCNVLEGLGVEPGDRVGTFAWNNYQHVELYFGVPGRGRWCIRSTFASFPISWPTSSTTPRTR